MNILPFRLMISSMIVLITIMATSTRALAQPNIIFMLADDLGWGDLGVYGHPNIRTPVLNRLAADGTMFTQFYSASPVCSPSRAAFMTGRFPANIGFHNIVRSVERDAANGTTSILDPTLPLVTRLLQSNGYRVGHFGKWHLTANDAPDRPPLSAYGIDESTRIGQFPGFGEPDFRSQLAESIVDRTIDFIEERNIDNPDRPFYINAWFVLPHTTLTHTPEQLAVYDRFESSAVGFTSAPQLYMAGVTALDTAIGRLLEFLDSSGLADNTIVIFASDNGPEGIYFKNARHSGFGSAGPFRGRKRSLYEGGIRMPFIVRWPGNIPAGRVNRNTVISAVDLLPTLVELAGVQAPQVLDGESMADVWLRANRARTTPLMWEWRYGDLYNVAAPPINSSPILAIRSGDWKFLMNPPSLTCEGQAVPARPELYNIRANPMETDNRFSERRELRIDLRNQLIAWWRSFPAGPCARWAGEARYRWP